MMNKKLYLNLLFFGGLMTLISSATVFAGQYPLIDYSLGENVNPYVKIAVCVFVFLVFAFLIDTRVKPFARYVANSFYYKDFSFSNIFLMLVSSVILSGVIWYSFTMSKDSADMFSLVFFDENALKRENADLSSEYQVKIDSLTDKFDARTAQLLAPIESSLEMKNQELNTASAIADSTLRSVTTRRVIAAINDLEAKKIALTEKRDEEYQRFISEQRELWSMDEIMNDKDVDSDYFKDLILKYSERFTFLSGWSIILFFLSSCALEICVLRSKRTEDELKNGTIVEFFDNFTTVFIQNSVNASRFVGRKISLKEQNRIKRMFLSFYADVSSSKKKKKRRR